MNPKKTEEFVPVHLYIENWSYYTPRPAPAKDEKTDEDDVERGVCVIDIM